MGDTDPEGVRNGWNADEIAFILYSMIQYYPLAFSAPWDDADKAGLVSYEWQDRVASFATNDGEFVVRVLFRNGAVLRLLDDFPLSTEEGRAECLGLVPHHFAYRVEGDPFFAAQSEIWREVAGPMQHYRLMTGAGCLDAIASEAPLFEIVRQL